MESSSPAKVKVALIGATGAIGKEVVRFAMWMKGSSELTLLVRTKNEEWKEENCKPTLKIIERPDFDDLSDLKDALTGYDIFICTLGSRTKHGEETFVKVDYQYPLNFANLGLECGVKYYSLLSSAGSGSKSWLLYMRTKGRVEEALMKYAFPFISIHKPGLLLNRDGDKRTMEGILSVLPFGPRNESRSVGKVMLEKAIIDCKKEL
eukprot:CAMPEP_0170544730 /NCGR_PEP_ID=MMETSP0211-20121228/3381_1 /TAXON_ID=311385 /ORGANISM="Pseudokeronopsis sp., Strain OXSARD2" /LENGTH=206 /DNA_ID=CAMNT_0010848447 /DNA_START=1 /DNA_END=621 /DNA_ORIENTATION=-